jgi:hypothetical protein
MGFYHAPLDPFIINVVVDTIVPGDPLLLTAIVTVKEPIASSPAPAVIATLVTMFPVNGNHAPGPVKSGVTVPAPFTIISTVST